ncbi:hypothetical protein LOC67_23485 [Stieleria sp. JC731]|uniref:hypothetical protein n=1 Tax=Pirellulaceae TaxID=2691357 RepID=UPI001E3A940F|nr:hypothetical protein [Stieleria sp. JC731]MCC9603523.1 hypothetical protein [Stieleria sp. JC731]
MRGVLYSILLVLCIATPSFAQVEVSGNVDASTKPFTVILIDAPRPQTGFGSSSVPVPGQLEQMLRQPRTQPLFDWLSVSEISTHYGVDDIVREHHGDLIQGVSGYPIVALVGPKGGTWCKLSGNQVPTDEYQLARKFDMAQAAILDAAARAGQNPFDSMSSDQLANAILPNTPPYTPVSNPNDPTGPPTRGPSPLFNRGGDSGGGLFNVRPNIVVPDNAIPIEASASIGNATLITAIIITLILGGVIVWCASLWSATVTDRD